MSKLQFLLYDQKKAVSFRPERMSLYMQSAIIEVLTEDNELYYLFFYKQQFLTAMKTTKLRRHSHIQHAFKEVYFILHAPNPLIHFLLSSIQPIKAITSKQLFKKLEMHYTAHERALILTFFESFIPKKILFKEILEIFYEYRRNGQMAAAYQIIHILKDFAPEHSLVQKLGSEITFSKFAELYQRKSVSLFEKDAVFAEKTMFSNKDTPEYFYKLIAHLEKDSRWIDLIALYIYKLKTEASIDYYKPLLQLMEDHLQEEETVGILESIASHLTNFEPLNHDLFEKYFNQNKLERILTIMTNYSYTPSPSQAVTIETLIVNLDFETQSLEPERLNTLLPPLFELMPKAAEHLLNKTVFALIKKHEIEFIEEWISPLKSHCQGLATYEKLIRIIELNNNLEELQSLGELYYEFRHLEKAIECFSWEMEFKPSNPKPVQWLSKIHRELGMKLESEAYQQHSVNLQKKVTG